MGAGCVSVWVCVCYMCIGMCVFVCVSISVSQYGSKGMCMFLPLDWKHLEGRDCVLLILTPPASSPMCLSYSMYFCWIMNENKITLYLVKANYMSIPFPFLLSNLSGKCPKFFKYCCRGYMEGANSFHVQVPCGINTFFYPCGVTV